MKMIPSLIRFRAAVDGFLARDPAIATLGEKIAHEFTQLLAILDPQKNDVSHRKPWDHGTAM